MLVLYETALGFCLFKLTDTAKLETADLWEEFESPERANKLYVPINVCVVCGFKIRFLLSVAGAPERKA